MYLVYLYLPPLQYLTEDADEVNYSLLVYLYMLYLPPLQYLIEAADESILGQYIWSILFTSTIFDIEAADEVIYICTVYVVYIYILPLQYLIEAADEDMYSTFGLYCSCYVVIRPPCHCLLYDYNYKQNKRAVSRNI